MQATRRMPLGALAIALATGAAGTQNYLACWTRTRTDFSLTCHSVQRARLPLSSRAISLGSFTVRWQGTSCSSSFVSKVLGANYNRANNFHPVANKFATCTPMHPSGGTSSTPPNQVSWFLVNLLAPDLPSEILDLGFLAPLLFQKLIITIIWVFFGLSQTPADPQLLSGALLAAVLSFL